MLTLNNINNRYNNYSRPILNSNNINFRASTNTSKDEFICNSEMMDSYKYFMSSDFYDLTVGYMVNEDVYPPAYQTVLKTKIPALNNKHFTKEDYDNLTPKEKKILDKIINKKLNMSFGLQDRSIKNDAKKILKIAQNIKDNMDKKYPNGYKLVSIGNSAAPITETMRMLGADTHTIPFSIDGLTIKEGFPYRKFNQPEPYKKEDWKNYLEHHGIDKDFEERTGKKLVITDYVFSGYTMKVVKNIFGYLGFSNDTEFANVTDLPNSLKHKERFKLESDLLDQKYKYLSEKMTGKMCIQENTDFVKHPEYIENQDERFASKIFKYAIFRNLEEKNTPLIEKIFKKIF